MNMHTPEQLRQHEDHAKARKRLLGGKANEVSSQSRGAYEIEIARLRKRQYDTAAKLAEALKDAQDARQAVDEMTMVIADFNATMIRQACAISTLMGSESHEGKRSVRAIAAQVLLNFPGISFEDVQGISRKKEMVIPRQICMAAIKEERPELSYPFIGRQFGGRDHTTVLHAVQKVKAIMEKVRS